MCATIPGMSAAAPLLPDPTGTEDVDRFVHLRGAAWADYQRLLEDRSALPSRRDHA